MKEDAARRGNLALDFDDSMPPELLARHVRNLLRRRLSECRSRRPMRDPDLVMKEHRFAPDRSGECVRRRRREHVIALHHDVGNARHIQERSKQIEEVQ